MILCDATTKGQTCISEEDLSDGGHRDEPELLLELLQRVTTVEVGNLGTKIMD